MLTDFCNECGNCATSCPTAGDPYRDKPRLYLDRADFEAEADNAFMLLADDSIEARWDGETHHLRIDGDVRYRSRALDARLDAETLDLIEARVTDAARDGEVISLDRAADMYVLLRGLQGSMRHLPRSGGDASPGTRVAQPALPA